MTNVLLATLLPALERRFKAMKVGDTENIRIEIPLEISGSLSVITPEYSVYITAQTAAWIEKTNVIFVIIERKR